MKLFISSTFFLFLAFWVGAQSISREEGIASFWKSEEHRDQYYARYDGAPVGSILKVQSGISKKTIFVEVYEPLNSKSKSNLVIVLSPKAYNALGVSAPVCKVSVEFSEDQSEGAFLIDPTKRKQQAQNGPVNISFTALDLNNNPSNKVQSGTASLLNGTGPKFAALHPRAQRGTLVMVTNPANNKMVVVEVVGNFDPLYEPGVIIKLTAPAFTRLGLEPKSSNAVVKISDPKSNASDVLANQENLHKVAMPKAGLVELPRLYAFHRKHPAGTLLRLRNPRNSATFGVTVLGPLLEIDKDPQLKLQISETAFRQLGGMDESASLQLEEKVMGRRALSNFQNVLYQNGNTFEKGLVRLIQKNVKEPEGQAYYALHQDLPIGSIVLVAKPGKKGRNNFSSPSPFDNNTNSDPLAQLSQNSSQTNNSSFTANPNNNTFNNPVKQHWVVVEIIGKLDKKEAQENEVIQISKAAWYLLHGDDDPEAIPITLSYFDL